MHRLQTEAERVKPADLLSPSSATFHREKLTMRERHVAVARCVTDYEFNNTYQYVIAREDVHLSWLEAALAELGGTPDDVAGAVSCRRLGSEGRASAARRRGRAQADAFVARWRPRLGSHQRPASRA